MVEFFSEYALFLIKTLSIAVIVLFVTGTILTMARRADPGERGQLRVRRLNDRFDAIQDSVEQQVLNKREVKTRRRMRKREEKQRRHRGDPRGRAFVVDFHGDIRASQVDSLREEINAIVSAASEGDEVVVRLESPGGMVHTYGLAASQLRRLREHKLSVTVSVDKVAASGGYMMACVAERIVAAPFAIIGSIGVIGQLPNFHRLLQKNSIDFEQHTAGEYKRTLTMFGRNTATARRKFQHDLEETHQLFKDFVAEHRPALDLEKTATGEYWFGQQALGLGLVDELRTSDDYLLALSQERDIYEVNYRTRPRLSERLAGGATAAWRQVTGAVADSDRESRLPHS